MVESASRQRLMAQVCGMLDHRRSLRPDEHSHFVAVDETQNDKEDDDEDEEENEEDEDNVRATFTHTNRWPLTGHNHPGRFDALGWELRPIRHEPGLSHLQILAGWEDGR